MAIAEWHKMALVIFGHLDSSGKFAGRQEKVAGMKPYVIISADKSQLTQMYYKCYLPTDFFNK